VLIFRQEGESMSDDMQPASSAQPGWYPVEGQPRWRYWDGEQWTDKGRSSADARRERHVGVLIGAIVCFVLGVGAFASLSDRGGNAIDVVIGALLLAAGGVLARRSGYLS
jgi:hypothetical protein